MSEPREFIVAEVSKNWPQMGQLLSEECLCGLFEAVIEVNRGRGYTLHSFTLNQVVTEPGCMIETIIAVFRRNPPARA